MSYPRWETAGSRPRSDYKSRRTTTGSSNSKNANNNLSDMANRPMLLDTWKFYKNSKVPTSKSPGRRNSTNFQTQNYLALATQQQEHNTIKQYTAKGRNNPSHWPRTSSSTCFSVPDSNSTTRPPSTGHSSINAPAHSTEFDRSKTTFSRRFLGHPQYK